MSPQYCSGVKALDLDGNREDDLVEADSMGQIRHSQDCGILS
jgi:hypothetical protein